MLLLRWDTGKFKGRFGGMVRFMGGLRCNGRVTGVIITENRVKLKTVV